jgi:hypothetical protein
MPKTICVLHAKTLEKAKYYLKVMFEVSDKFYQHGSFTPIYGNGQGSTNSPSAWLFISNNIFKCHCKHANGAYYTDPDNETEVQLYLAGFVDDINIYANKFTSTTMDATTLINNLQRDITLFSWLLWTTGGQLEPKKCNYTMMHWKFTEDGDPYLDDTTHSSIEIKDVNHKVCSTIKFLHPEEASKYLGHIKEVAGTQISQEEKLKEVIKSETAFVATSHLNPSLTYRYYTAIFQKKVQYPLTLSYFSKKKLRKLQKRYHKVLLRALGYNQNTAIPVRYGSPFYAGIGLRCLYLEQGLASIMQFMRHWRSDKSISKLLRITVAWCQFSLGTGVPFLQDMNRELPHFESKWLKGLRCFLRHINGYIVLDDDHVPPLQRKGDFHLMDKVIDSQQFTFSQIKKINYC